MRMLIYYVALNFGEIVHPQAFPRVYRSHPRNHTAFSFSFNGLFFEKFNYI